MKLGPSTLVRLIEEGATVEERLDAPGLSVKSGNIERSHVLLVAQVGRRAEREERREGPRAAADDGLVDRRLPIGAAVVGKGTADLNEQHDRFRLVQRSGHGEGRLARLAQKVGIHPLFKGLLDLVIGWEAKG